MHYILAICKECDREATARGEFDVLMWCEEHAPEES